MLSDLDRGDPPEGRSSVIPRVGAGEERRTRKRVDSDVENLFDAGIEFEESRNPAAGKLDHGDTALQRVSGTGYRQPFQVRGLADP